MESVSLVVCDVDGVLTDGGMHYHSSGSESKKFSVYDGGAPPLLEDTDIDLVILSGEKNGIVEKRCEKIGIDDVRLGVKNKSKEIKKLISFYGVKKKNVLVIVDFINDINIMRKFKSVCPSSAPEVAKNMCNEVLNVDGGNGVLWEVAKRLLKSRKLLEKKLKEYSKGK